MKKKEKNKNKTEEWTIGKEVKASVIGEIIANIVWSILRVLFGGIVRLIQFLFHLF